MAFQTQLVVFLLVWVAAVVIVLIRTWTFATSSGLTIFYIANLTLIHFFGALVYVLPWYPYGAVETTLKGFRLATYGIVAFCIGNLILTPYVMELFHIESFLTLKHKISKLPKTYALSSRSVSNLPLMYLIVGMFSYFLFFTFLGRVPTLRALVSVGQQLMVIAICLGCWKMWIEGNKTGLIAYLLLSLCFPFVTVLVQGFLGYGTIMTLSILLFAARFYRPRWKVIMVSVFMVYFGFTFYQSYMRDRTELRDTIWGGASIIERIEELGETLGNTEWFNPFDVKHLGRIDDRLNQNYLVGKAVDYLKAESDYALGKTLWESLLALVPRIIWRDKPIYAGSGDIVSKHTGMIFSKGTSVGVGQVMELYINFGTLGVIFGFLILGIIVELIDVMASNNLLKGNWQRFASWILPGLAILQVGGSFVEVTASAGAGIVVALFASKLRSRHYRLMLAAIYLVIVVYIANFYLDIFMLIVVIAISVKKYLFPFFSKMKGSMNH